MVCEEFVEAVDGVGVDAGQDVAEPGEGFDADELAGADEAAERDFQCLTERRDKTSMSAERSPLIMKRGASCGGFQRIRFCCWDGVIVFGATGIR